MPRQARVVIAGQPHHIIQRGNNRQNIFTASKDYNFYLSKLHEASTDYECEVHAYVLMTNHTHLLITPNSKDALSDMMRKLGTSYVNYFNYNYQRTGSLMEGRYRSTCISNEAYFLICMRYIELNPVRACIVQHPLNYEWSSYQANALGQKNSIITPHSIYLSLAEHANDRYKLYENLFSIPLSNQEIKKMQAFKH